MNICYLPEPKAVYVIGFFIFLILNSSPSLYRVYLSIILIKNNMDDKKNILEVTKDEKEKI